MNSLKKIFKTNKPIIGALHFMPLLGFEGNAGLESVLKKAIHDFNTLQKGGVDGIILENNYDLPHKIVVEPETVASMTYLGYVLKRMSKIPIGISVLWNDYRSALSISKTINASFIRIPAFVDDVKTDFGIANKVSKDALKFRKQIKAENIAIFADVQVKHSSMIDKSKPISTSIKQAIKAGADAIIITGNWTGNPPEEEKLQKARIAAGNFPLLVGSGADKNNISNLFKYVDGAIVSTSLKEGANKNSERNVKNYKTNISLVKVKQLVKATRD